MTISVKWNKISYRNGLAMDKGLLSKCPGLYCGRELLPDGSWGNCSACPRGFRANASSACVPCNDSPVFYDWLYLGFMVLLALILHWFFIDIVAMRRSFLKEVLCLHLSAVFEIVTAAFLTLLLSDPMGSLNLRSCHVEKLSDWYTLLHNPNPNYSETLHCTQEAVYPLYTIMFIFYALAVVLMLLLRPWLAAHFLPKQGKMSIYAALYFFPTLALIQAVFGGLIYYSFPYIIIVISVFSNATHFAFKLDQSMRFLLFSTIVEFRNMVILIGHWLLHAYGIIAITQLKDPIFHASLLALVPLPAVFYILTAQFTDPNKLHTD
ncbi:hypothetical protein R5R35_004700 [Gryllus longicercus]|uniref:JNK1/MAPK8-associated membrane protein n=2 Tax=Gryllus longicercus TaxID=2509291 RepID=A0AAN9VEE1_9ORTH